MRGVAGNGHPYRDGQGLRKSTPYELPRRVPDENLLHGREVYPSPRVQPARPHGGPLGPRLPLFAGAHGAARR